jgi:hypothetical protein
MQTSGADTLSAKQLSRRMFMRRGALMAAGGLVAGSVAIPGWMRFLAEQMEKLQPKPRVEIRQPQVLWETYAFDPEGEGGFEAAFENLRKQFQKRGLIKEEFRQGADPDLKFDVPASAWPQQGLDGVVAVTALTYSVWFGLKEG